VLKQALDEFFARIGRLFLGRSERVGREEHFGFDVNERRRHVDEFGRDIHVELFKFVKVVEILRGDE